jgi:hypothetical protein
MAIAFPDIERETYYAAVAEPGWGTDSRAALKEAVVAELRRGTDREHVLAVLDELADDLGARGFSELEEAVLDVMDTMVGWAHASKQI